MTEPLTDPTPLCPVCGCGVVDDLETTAAGVYAHGECLGEAAMLDRIAELTAELEHRDLFQRKVNRHLGQAVEDRSAAEIRGEESRKRVARAEAKLATVRSELDAAREVIESRVLLGILTDAEVRGKIAAAAADAAREMLTALGIDLDAPPPAREPDGWIMGQLRPSSYEKARELLDSARRLYPSTEARLYEVREVRS